jgi:hypothetical protein
VFVTVTGRVGVASEVGMRTGVQATSAIIATRTMMSERAGEYVRNRLTAAL